MNFDLPPDDDGLDVAALSRPMSKPDVKPKVKPFKRPSAAAGAMPAPRLRRLRCFESLEEAMDDGVALPSDLDGDEDELFAVPKAPPKVSKAKAQPKQRQNGRKQEAEPDLMDWADERLKDPAARIPSILEMPMEDLAQQWQNPRPPPGWDTRCVLWEIYSVPRFGPVLRSLGGTSRRSYDLLNFWNLSMDNYRRTLLQDVSILRPLFLALSPPCTFVCPLMASNWPRMRNHKKYMCLQDAFDHIDLTAWLATFQVDTRAYFGFEHPDKSLAWGRGSVSCYMFNPL